MVLQVLQRVTKPPISQTVGAEVELGLEDLGVVLVEVVVEEMVPKAATIVYYVAKAVIGQADVQFIPTQRKEEEG